jgi:hypothetical protein
MALRRLGIAGGWTTARDGNMTDSEKKLLTALVKMVNQYLDDNGDLVDSLSMSAGEHAIEALSDFGLMVNLNTRFGQWTEDGKRFRAESQILRAR